MRGKQQKLYSHKLEQVLVLAQSFLLSLVLLTSSSLERFVHREAWLVPPEAEAERALALLSARLELVGEPPGLVEGAVGGEALHGVLLGVGALDVGASVTAVAVIVR